ncbi:MAG: PQQ-binding-like beta-propeller repeat protein [Syntrophales bacterium]
MRAGLIFLADINPDGSQKWEQTFADSVWGMSSGIAVSYDDATVYGVGQAGKLYAVQSSDGAKLWEFTTGDGGGNMYSTPVVGQDGTIYFGGGGLQ